MTSFHSWHSISTVPKKPHHLSVPSHSGSIFLTFSRFLSVYFSSRPCCFLITLWIRVVQCDELLLFFFSSLSTLCSVKVRGNRTGLPLSSWHLEVRAVRRSGAWGSVSSMCRNTTFNSCWRIALFSCAPPGQIGPWPSSGSTLRDWRRFVGFCFYFFGGGLYWSGSKSVHSESWANIFCDKLYLFTFKHTKSSDKLSKSVCLRQWMPPISQSLSWMCFVFL